LISVLIPTFNEEDNVIQICEAIQLEFMRIPQYEYEIVFIDNYSKDNTRQIIASLCAKFQNVKAIFNTRNFGPLNSPFYGICQCQGDCVILICADFQDPVSMIPLFIEEWEKGYKVVCGIKMSSMENRIVYFLRSFYYKLIKSMSEIEQIEHFTGFGLYDHSFIEVLRTLNDPMPFLRGIVAELGPERKDIPYEQAKRRAGKTSYNWYKLYDVAMLSFTSYTKIGLRLATLMGFFFSTLSLLAGFIYFIMKLIWWNRFPAGTLPILLGVFVFSSVQMFFIGLIGEYILNINSKIMKRPLVIEEKRINFEDQKDHITYAS